jgi:F0F1-type ATP synthase membrane subunit b/b'
MEAELENLRQQQEEIRKAAEAKAKAEREAAQAARLEALKPEIEKAQGFAECIVTDAMDSLQRLGNPSWGDDAMHIIRNCGSSIVALVIQR